VKQAGFSRAGKTLIPYLGIHLESIHEEVASVGAVPPIVLRLAGSGDLSTNSSHHYLRNRVAFWTISEVIHS
jgi:hypothetical protein